MGQKSPLAPGEPGQVGADPVPDGSKPPIMARMALPDWLAADKSGSRHRQRLQPGATKPTMSGNAARCSGRSVSFEGSWTDLQ